ncbi:hypothetical protein NPIL_126711 [Nephila pilipes]|uniref:Uncharacterized protein n=1 Tax=Nephila pilipes TaxID=299642 RepID=A0A8X6P8D3_NEPPI|nr:hypothetical protein NPIL_126711 [Nephila pilipes]
MAEKGEKKKRMVGKQPQVLQWPGKTNIGKIFQSPYYLRLPAECSVWNCFCGKSRLYFLSFLVVEKFDNKKEEHIHLQALPVGWMCSTGQLTLCVNITRNDEPYVSTCENGAESSGRPSIIRHRHFDPFQFIWV